MDIKSREQINYERTKREGNNNHGFSLAFDYNDITDIMTIEGIAYEGDFLRYLHGLLQEGNVTLELKGQKISIVSEEKKVDKSEFSCPHCDKSYGYKMHLSNHQKKCQEAKE